MRFIMTHGLTEDLTAYANFMWAQASREPSEASIREMLPLVLTVKGR